MSDRDVVCVDMEISETLACAKKPRFTHVRGNLRGDVSGKRFSTHDVEVNVADVA